MYAGAITDATPTPIPPTTRQKTSHSMDCVKPQPIAESRNNSAAIFMMGMRPVRSAMREPKNAPTAAPRRAAATAKPRGPGPTSNVDWMEETAPLITAESYPKRRPPNAATVVMRMTAPVFV